MTALSRSENETDTFSLFLLHSQAYIVAQDGFIE